MSRESGVSSTSNHELKTSALGASPTSSGDGSGLASNSGAFEPLYDYNENAFAAPLSARTSGTEYFNASFGPIIAGHYTEF